MPHSEESRFRSPLAACAVATASVVALIVGCSESGEAVAPKAAAPVEQTAPAEPQQAADSPTPAASAPEPQAAAQAVAAAGYKPPFPERTNLFEPPRQAPRSAKRNGGDSTDSVVLMGFADLGEPLAVLAIDGVVTPLAGGAESGGVRVISIVPPKAVLQRGRSRWTASIE